MEQASVVVDARDITPALLATPFLVPLFGTGNRQRAALEAARIGFVQAFTLVDPSSATPRHWSLGPGTYVNGGCAVGSACQFGEFVFVNRGACIGHHLTHGTNTTSRRRIAKAPPWDRWGARRG